MPKISVIVPIYNLEQYIEKCIGTILSQSFRDFELLLIDDGSTDGSFSLCQEYCKMDGRITAHRQSNQGVSAARNTGLAMAKGDYIIFVDGDDYLKGTFLEQLYALAETQQADIAICGFKITKSLKEPLSGEEKWMSRLFTQEEALKLFLYPGEIDLGISAWNKLFKRECLEQLSFQPHLRMNEDKYLVFEALCCSSKIVYTSQVLYYYYYREQSACRTRDYEQWLDCVTVGETIYKDVCQKQPKLELWARYQLVDVYYFVFNIIIALDINANSALWEIKNKLNNVNLKGLGPYFRFKQKLSVLLIKILPIGVYRCLLLRIGHFFRKW